MWTASLLFLLLLFAVVQPRRVGPAQRIINGTAAQPGQVPWQASVTLDAANFCGGSIIAPTWVLTAAHCAHGVISFVLVFGSLDPNGVTAGAVRVTSRIGIVHDGFNPDRFLNDIALVELPTSLAWSADVRAIHVPASDMQDVTDRRVMLSGWGSTGYEMFSSTLLIAELVVVSNGECAAWFGSKITASNVCTSGTTGSAACHGDSGGPLTLGDVQVGVVSYGSAAGCGLGRPDVYTRVSSYETWLYEHAGVTAYGAAAGERATLSHVVHLLTLIPILLRYL